MFWHLKNVYTHRWAYCFLHLHLIHITLSGKSYKESSRFGKYILKEFSFFENFAKRVWDLLQNNKMKKIFTPEFIAQIFFQIILSGIVVFYFQEYIKNKDEAEQELLKSKYAGISAESVAKKQNLINDKRDAYFEALKIVNKALVNSDFFEFLPGKDTSMVEYAILLANAIKSDLTDSNLADTFGMNDYKVIEIHRPH